MKKKRKRKIRRNQFDKYTDDRGYVRVYPPHSNLIHRQNAYKYIYLPNRKKYRKPFSYYVVHHIDGNKGNNHSSNLQLLSWKAHGELHAGSREPKITQDPRYNGGSPEEEDFETSPRDNEPKTRITTLQKLLINIGFFIVSLGAMYLIVASDVHQSRLMMGMCYKRTLERITKP